MVGAMLAAGMPPPDVGALDVASVEDDEDGVALPGGMKSVASGDIVGM